jgi:hypothetical protein
LVCRARMVSAVSRKRGRSFRIASSKAIICAVSNSEPIGRTESLPAAIVGHCLGGNHGQDVDVLGELARRLGGDQRRARARLTRDVEQCLRRREIARSGGSDEEIAGAERGRRRVAPDRDIPAL